jgi:HD superfamily phosphohydrolase YqeK
MLYLADYLDPGRSFQPAERAALAAQVLQNRGDVLREVARRRLGWLRDAGSPLLKESVDFWNALSASPPPLP